MNPFHRNYSCCRRLPHYCRNMNGWFFLKEPGEVLSIMAFLNIIHFCPNGIGYFLDDPHQIILLCPFPMVCYGYRRTCQNEHVFLYRFRHTGLLHFYHHLRAVSHRTSINLSNRRNAYRIRSKLAEYFIGWTT